MRDVDEPFEAFPERRRTDDAPIGPGRSLVAVVGLAVATLVVAAVVGLSQLQRSTSEGPVGGDSFSGSTTEPVVRGEVVLSEDPHIVLGGESPLPRFDRSQLGREAPLTPVPVSEVVDDMARWQRVLPGMFQEGPSEIGQITVIGATPGGVHAYVVTLEGGEDPDEKQRCTLTVAAAIGASCRAGPGWDLNPSFVTSLGEERVEDGLTWTVSEGTSVVMLSVNGERRWQRPIGRLAVFDVALRVGDEVRLIAFDTEGDRLTSRELIAGID